MPNDLAELVKNKSAQMVAWAKTILILITLGTLLSACSTSRELSEVQIEATQIAEAESLKATEPLTSDDASSPLPTDEASSLSDSTNFSLPKRAGPQTQTTGSVPHVQIDVTPLQAVSDELVRLAFALPGVEDRPTIVSLPGAQGMWLADDILLAHPEAIVSGREFAHIHPDGSLHAPLPFERALEVTEKGWGERHPWADDREGWDGFVMLYTPLSMEELDVTFQLIVESYNHVTGLAIQVSDIK